MAGIEPGAGDEALTRALAAAIDAIGTAGFMTGVLDYLRAATPFVGALVVVLDGNRRPGHLYDNVRAARRTEVVDHYLDGAYLLDPFYEEYRRASGDRVVPIRDVAPDRFRQTAYFRRYYRATHLQDEVAVFVALAGRRHLFYSIGRREHEARFSRRDMAGFRRALPVFAALNRRHFADRGYPSIVQGMDADESRVQAAMERFGTGLLTDREREVAALVLRGHSTRSIADRADISVETVKIHRKNLYRKLAISSQSELFARFLDDLGG